MTSPPATLVEPERPRLAAHLHLVVVAGDHAVLLSENGHRILPGRVYAELLPLLDGTRSVSALMATLDGVVSPGEVAFALQRAAAAGLIVDGPAEPGLTAPQEAFWNALGHAGSGVVEQLAQRAVQVRGLGGAPLQALRAALAADEARLVAGDADLLVVATDDYLRPELAEINSAALAAGQPWLLTRLTGHTAWLGPLFEPGETACWECLAQRLRANRQAERFLAESRARPGPFPTATAALDPTVDAAAALVATHAVRWLATGSNAVLAGRVVTIGLAGGPARGHDLVRRPQCAACGAAPGAPRDASVPLRPAPGGVAGGARGAGAEELLERFGRHVSPITGVVSELRAGPEADPALGFTCTAVHDFPMFREEIEVLRQNLWGRSGGKGTTRPEAQAGALGEALERYSCVWRGEEEPARRASARELGDDAVALADCLGFSARQLAERDAWNRALTNPHHVVPAPLDPDLTISWTPLWSLTHARVAYLPSAYCYYGHPDMRHFFCLGDSNGCAAGSTLEEAVYHGLMELIERDAVAIWWYNRLRRPAVEVDAGAVPFHAQLRDRLREEQRELWLLELTCDTAIPTYAAVSARCDHAAEDILLGFASDLDPATAIRRALTELAQSHPQVARRRASGATIYGTRDRETLDWLRAATRASEPYLVPAPGMSPRRIADHERCAHADLRDDVVTCVERLRALGLDVLVLDQTRPDVGMPACRVVVPGLCHFWRRLGSRRLSEAPLRLGWLERATPEDELNPNSVFF